MDAVCGGMTLIGAALVERRHDPLYQLATSVTNPCDMGRSIELTSLGHRRHYRAQEGLEYWLRLRMDAIPVSKERYNRMSAPAQKMIIKSIQRDDGSAAVGDEEAAGARPSATWSAWRNWWNCLSRLFCRTSMTLSRTMWRSFRRR